MLQRITGWLASSRYDLAEIAGIGAIVAGLALYSTVAAFVGGGCLTVAWANWKSL